MIITRRFALANLSLVLFCFLTGCDNQDKLPEKPQLTGSAAILENLKNFPDSFLLYEEAVQFYRDADKYDSAIFYASKAIEKDTTISRFWYIRGTLMIENGDTLAGIKNLERSVAIATDPRVLSELGRIWAVTKNPKALKVSTVLQDSKEEKASLDAWFIEGLYYSSIGRKAEAISWFDKCLKLSYTYMEAYIEKGNALYDLGKYEAAVSVFQKAVTVQNNFDIGYYYLGRTLEKLNRKDDAAEAYRTALMYDKNYADARDALQRLEK